MAQPQQTSHHLWRTLDAIVYFPLTLLFLSFWIFLGTMEQGPAVLYQFYAGSRNAADDHGGVVLLASVLYGLYSASLFFPQRRLLGCAGRRVTVVLAACFFVVALATFFAAGVYLAGARM